MEADEAGKLRAFREKFGRGWDAGRLEERDREEGRERVGGEEGEGDGGEEEQDNLMDLISGFGREAGGVREGKEKSGKGKGGER